MRERVVAYTSKLGKWKRVTTGGRSEGSSMVEGGEGEKVILDGEECKVPERRVGKT